MASRHPDKLLAGLPKVKSGRRQQYSSATKKALVEVAARLFTEQGYAATSLDAIVAGARVTKGALYHHFTGKQALFEAVFEKVEGDAARRIKAALRDRRDPWDKALAGLRAFLTVVQDPTYQRIVIQEGPAILGYERFREQEERSSYAIVQDIVRDVLDAGALELDEAMLGTFSRIFFGALSAAGETVSSAEDPQAAVAQVETAITFILTGLRTLAEAGTELPGPGGAATS
jgi:AcrR family transcriptional regulator